MGVVTHQIVGAPAEATDPADGRFPMQLGRIMVPDFTAPRACDVDLDFMRYRLDRIIRFSGHPRALSVGEHQRLVTYLTILHGEPPAITRWAGVHDAHEYALGDTVAPLKRILGAALEPLEAAWDAAIAGALMIPLPTATDRERVRVYDLLSLRLEWRWVLGLPAGKLGPRVAGLPFPEEGETEALAVLMGALGARRAREIVRDRSTPIDEVLA